MLVRGEDFQGKGGAGDKWLEGKKTERRGGGGESINCYQNICFTHGAQTLSWNYETLSKPVGNYCVFRCGPVLAFSPLLTSHIFLKPARGAQLGKERGGARIFLIVRMRYVMHGLSPPSVKWVAAL